jgi:hypothetical protein
VEQAAAVTAERNFQVKPELLERLIQVQVAVVVELLAVMAVLDLLLLSTQTH